jgi:hypothetical protein
MKVRRKSCAPKEGTPTPLTAYCGRVRQHLQTFDHAEKRLAIEALDSRVSWIPGQPLIIQGTIPLSDIADSPSKNTNNPNMSR